MATIGEMRDNGMLLPDTAVRVDNAIKKLDDAATKAGLPKLADIVDPPIGGTQPRSKTAELIEQIAALAKKARDAANPQNMNEAEKRRAIDRLFGLLPRGAGPALTGPGYTVFRDTVVWNSEMFDESSKAMNLVADAMTTGKFDQQTFGKIESRMKDLAKGPWTEKTAVDFFERLCKGIPVAGPWCGEAFKLFKAKSSDVDCAAISCDCDNVPGGLMKGPLIVQCRIRQPTQNKGGTVSSTPVFDSLHRVYAARISPCARVTGSGFGAVHLACLTLTPSAAIRDASWYSSSELTAQRSWRAPETMFSAASMPIRMLWS